MATTSHQKRQFQLIYEMLKLTY